MKRELLYLIKKILSIENVSSIIYKFLDYARQFEIKDKVYLNEMDIMLITGTNISKLHLEALQKLCFSCDKIINLDNLLKLECTCQMCKDCLKKYLVQATNGEMVLNKFEKSKILN